MGPRLHVSLVAVASLAVASCEASWSASSAVGVGVGVSVPPRPASAPSPLAGWTIGPSALGAYQADVDPAVEHDGHPTVALHTIADPGQHAYGTYVTTLDATPLRGKRVRASVWVRTGPEAVRGSFWIRALEADAPAEGAGLAAATQRLIAAADFIRYEVELIVPQQACGLQVGLGISWPGELWMDGVKVESE
ncbi:MAG TPA: hypothetical protein VIF15_10395 [Polyangiaceae bacterium]|jgi:hypothetical protein